MKKEEALESFDIEWEALLKCENRFRELATDVATGGKTKVSELDTSYNDMKASLKRIRKLAKEVDRKA